MLLAIEGGLFEEFILMQKEFEFDISGTDKYLLKALEERNIEFIFSLICFVSGNTPAEFNFHKIKPVKEKSFLYLFCGAREEFLKKNAQSSDHLKLEYFKLFFNRIEEKLFPKSSSDEELGE